MKIDSFSLKNADQCKDDCVKRIAMLDNFTTICLLVYFVNQCVQPDYIFLISLENIYGMRTSLGEGPGTQMSQ